MNYIILLYIITILAVIAIIINTETPSKASAYLFLVILVPVVGIIVYFTFGVNYRKQKIYNKKLAADKKAYPKLNEQIQELSAANLRSNKNKLKYFYTLAHHHQTEHILTSNNKATLLINGEQKFQHVIDSLRSAEHFIHIEYYIYENDDIGREIGEILIKKAQSGVEVRFIYDDFGSLSIRHSFVQNLREAGVEAFPFYKIRWILLANRINYRNHRKIIVVDGKVGYTGGVNISDKYINSDKSELYWRDTHLKLEGLSVMILQHIFLTDWNFCADQNIAFEEKYFPIGALPAQSEYGHLVQVIAGGPDYDHPDIMYAMIQAITLAREEILITTPYFSPNAAFMHALIIVANSGVAVKIIVPGVSDSAIVNAVSNSYYRELLEAGIQVYKYRKGFVHAKTMVCDKFVSFVGTTNLDQRSFELNFEVHGIVYDENLAEELSNAFFDDLQNSEELIYEKWLRRNKIEFFAERVVRLFAPLM